MSEYNSYAKKVIGDALKAMIADSEFTIEGLAKKAGLSKGTVYAILRGDGYTMDNFLSVCRVIKVHVEISQLTADNSNWPAPNKN